MESKNKIINLIKEIEQNNQGDDCFKAITLSCLFTLPLTIVVTVIICTIMIKLLAG